MIVGMFSLPAAIRWAGVVLSQEDRHTIPSSSAPSTATSMSLAIRSRLGRMYCPAWPALVIASLGAAVRTSKARPPTARIACFSGPTMPSRWLKQLARSEELLTIAILGFSMSSGVSPSAVHWARRMAQRVVPASKLLRNGLTGSLLCSAVGCLPRVFLCLPAEIGAGPFEPLLQGSHINGAAGDSLTERQAGRGARRLAHGEARPGHPGRRLGAMGH